MKRVKRSTRVLVALCAVTTAAACDSTPPSIVGEIAAEVPNEAAPLVRLVTFQTDEPSTASLAVDDGRRQWTVAGGDEPETSHAIAIVGMRPSTTHTVTIALEDERGNERTEGATITFDSAALPRDFPALTTVTSDRSRMEPGVTLLSVFRWLPRGPAPGGLLVAVDAEGEVIWYYTADDRISDARLSGRSTMLYQFGRGAREIDSLGNVVRTWFATQLEDRVPDGAIPVATDTFHHEIFEMQGGNFLTLSTTVHPFDDYPSTESAGSTARGPANVVSDLLVEFRPDGSIAREWDLADIIDPFRLGYVDTWGFYDRTDYRHVEGGTKDWSHANAIIHDPSDDSLIVSVRHQDAVIKVDRETGRLIWILGDPAGWSDQYQPFLLTPDESVQWPYHPHAPMLTSQGTLLLYDNGNFKALPPTPPVEAADNHSRAVEYAIDEEAMTVRQVWSYGGPDTDLSFTAFLGDADRLPRTGNILVTAGGYVVDPEGVPLGDTNAGRKFARILEVTHDAQPETVFELIVGSDDQVPGWTVYRGERLPGLP
jgi:arylsulfate sulfotransferase